MPRKNAKSAAASAPKARAWRDPDDAPEIINAMLDRATILKGGKVIQCGPPAARRQRQVAEKAGWRMAVNSTQHRSIFRQLAEFPRGAR